MALQQNITTDMGFNANYWVIKNIKFDLENQLKTAFMELYLNKNAYDNNNKSILGLNLIFKCTSPISTTDLVSDTENQIISGVEVILPPNPLAITVGLFSTAVQV